MGTNWTVEAGNECFLLAAAWNSATEALTLRVISRFLALLLAWHVWHVC